ncbi:putative Ubiquitin domain-containing protein [Helianthus annuus]|nr:putative Ubiquitin domain-containing protein [Helianthus annuus]
MVVGILLTLYSSSALYAETRVCSNGIVTEAKIVESRNNIVRKPDPWAYGDQPITLSELQEMRNMFWQNAVRLDGRLEIWEALRAATEGNLRNAQKIIDDNKIRLGNPDMSVCYDDRGTRYDLPLFVLSEPTNMDYRVLRVK